MKKLITLALVICSLQIFSQEKKYEKALSSYNDFKTLVSKVEKHREERLVSLDKFLEMSKDKNVIILDTRSDLRYNRKHIKGAIHLDFTDFTQEELNKLIPNQNTTILIYCNNNFIGDPIDFASKMIMPSVNLINETYDPNALKSNILSENTVEKNDAISEQNLNKKEIKKTFLVDNSSSNILSNQKPLMLALNIPTYINLYGYGYKNVYELDELVRITDPRIKFEGTTVK